MRAGRTSRPTPCSPGDPGAGRSWKPRVRHGRDAITAIGRGRRLRTSREAAGCYARTAGPACRRPIFFRAPPMRKFLPYVIILAVTAALAWWLWPRPPAGPGGGAGGQAAVRVETAVAEERDVTPTLEAV